MLFLIGGPFTDEEALTILQKVRDVEQARPELHLRVSILAPDMTRERAKRLLESVKPPFAHRLEMEGRIAVDTQPPFSSN